MSNRPYRGSRVIPFRMEDGLYAEMMQTISKRNRGSQEQPWNRTEFILIAIREKVAKMKRSANSRKKKNRPKVAVPQAD